MATETSGTVGSCSDALGHAIGMPQLCTETFGNQLFWLVVTLVVIYFIMSRIALPRIAEVLQQRANAIQGDLDKAEELKAKAVEAEEAYNQALKDARAQAAGIVAETKAEIQKELDAATAKADAEIAAKSAESAKAIDAIREGAIASVKEVATATAGEIVSTIMPAASDDTAVAKAIADRMKG